jgi:hypothetical protein
MPNLQMQKQYVLKMRKRSKQHKQLTLLQKLHITDTTSVFMNLPKMRESVCLSPAITLTLGKCSAISFAAFCMFDAPSKATESINSFFGSISLIIGKNNLQMYQASFLPPILMWLLQSITSRQQVGLFSEAAITFTCGISLIVAPSPNIMIPKVAASDSNLRFASSRYELFVASSIQVLTPHILTREHLVG